MDPIGAVLLFAVFALVVLKGTGSSSTTPTGQTPDKPGTQNTQDFNSNLQPAKPTPTGQTPDKPGTQNTQDFNANLQPAPSDTNPIPPANVAGDGTTPWQPDWTNGMGDGSTTGDGSSTGTADPTDGGWQADWTNGNGTGD